MRASSIQHPAKEPLVVIRQWQVEACGGNTTAAALLSFFEYWHDIKVDTAHQSRRSNDVAEDHGDGRSQSESTMQWHTEQELTDGIMGIARRETIKKALDLLQLKGFISIHRNPNPRYKFDRTKYFYFYPDTVNEYLQNRTENRASKNSSPSSKNRRRSSENRRPSSENRETITEITPEITSETSSEITSIDGKTDDRRFNKESSSFLKEEGEEQQQPKEVIQNSRSVDDKKEDPQKDDKTIYADKRSAASSRQIIDYIEKIEKIGGVLQLPWEIREKGSPVRYDEQFTAFVNEYRARYENLEESGSQAHGRSLNKYMSKSHLRNPEGEMRLEMLVDLWNDFVSANN